MYSSIEEAYPNQGPLGGGRPGAAGRMAPLRGAYGATAGAPAQRGPAQGGQGPQAFSPYGPDRGREYAPLRAQGPQGPQEGFAVGPAAAFADTGACPNTNGRYLSPPSAMGFRERTTYDGQLQDYKHHCKQYGICPPGLEGFVADVPPSARASPQQGARQGQGQGCAPLSPPPYVYPMDDSDKRAYASALDKAMADSPAQYPFYKSPPRPRVNMDAIQGYGDDEMDTWMSLEDVSATPNVLPPIHMGGGYGSVDVSGAAARTAMIPQTVEAQRRPDALAGTSVGRFGPAPGPLSLSSSSPLSIPWMDALVFIAAGLLFIFLLDQLFKIAMNVGMRRTLQLMDEILARIPASQASQAVLAARFG